MTQRLEGRTFDEIGKALGVTTGRAHQLVDEALEATLREPAEEYRKIEIARLEAMMRGFFPKALKGNKRAIDGVLKIMDRQIKLLGLAAPTK
jgi:hypothetical protein